MTANAAITGSYADFKIVKTRSVAQLVIEIPIEKAQEAIEMFGLPIGGEEIPVALARLISPAEPPKRTNEAATERGRLAYATSGERERAVTRAAMLCGDVQFQVWLWRKTGTICEDDDEASHALRRFLGVTSRGEISSDDRAYQAFIALEIEYRQAHGLEAERRDR